MSEPLLQSFDLFTIEIFQNIYIGIYTRHPTRIGLLPQLRLVYGNVTHAALTRPETRLRIVETK